MLTVLLYALQRLHYFLDTIVRMEVMDLDNPPLFPAFSDDSDLASREGSSAMLGFGQAEVAAEHGPVIHGSGGFTLDELLRRRVLLLQECRDLRIRMIQEKFQLPVDMQEELAAHGRAMYPRGDGGAKHGSTSGSLHARCPHCWAVARLRRPARAAPRRAATPSQAAGSPAGDGLRAT